MKTLELYRAFVHRLAEVAVWPGMPVDDGWQLDGVHLVFCPLRLRFSALLSGQWSLIYVAKEIFANWEKEFARCPYFDRVQVLKLSGLFGITLHDSEAKTVSKISSCPLEACALQREMQDAYTCCAHKNEKFNATRPDKEHVILKEELRGRGLDCPHFFDQFLFTLTKPTRHEA